jgi:hypothetical protein
MSKNKLTLLSTLLAATLWTGKAAYATGNDKQGQEAELPQGHGHHGTAAGASGPAMEALAAVDARLDSVNADLAAGRTERVHGHAEAMNAALQGLDKDPSLDAVKQKRVAGYIKNIAKLTDSMHDAADAKKVSEARKWAKKLSAQVKLLDKQFAGGAQKAETGRGPDSAQAAHP